MTWRERFLNKITQGDCLKLLKEIPAESVDCIITSPPYNVGKDYGNGVNDSKSVEDYFNWTKEWLKLSFNVLKNGGRICINIPVLGNNPNVKKENKYLFYLPKFSELISDVGYKMRECITWIKSYKEYDENSFCGGNTAWGSWLSPSCPYCRSVSEFIVVAHKGSHKLLHKGESDLTKEEFLLWTKNVWFFPSEPNREHPAPFPLELPKRCIKLFSYIGDIILDPFMGSGTTAHACVMLKRKWIGFELNSSYCDMIKKRLHLNEQLKGWIK